MVYGWEDGFDEWIEADSGKLARADVHTDATEEHGSRDGEIGSDGDHATSDNEEDENASEVI